MPDYKVSNNLRSIMQRRTRADTSTRLVENQGHLICDPSAVNSARSHHNKIVDRATTSGFRTVKNDKTRHPLACHGLIKHDRKDVAYMAKQVTA